LGKSSDKSENFTSTRKSRPTEQEQTKEPYVKEEKRSTLFIIFGLAGNKEEKKQKTEVMA